MQQSTHVYRTDTYPFVDANKRIAPNTTVMLYFLNGYRFRRIPAHTEEIDLVDEIEQWRDDRIRYGLDELTGDSSNPID